MTRQLQISQTSDPRESCLSKYIMKYLRCTRSSASRNTFTC